MMTTGTRDRLAVFLDRCVDERLFPGCAAGFVIGGRPDIITAGRLTYERDSPAVTAATVYDTASITKSVATACCALKLIEEGSMTPDSCLVDFVPDYEGPWRDDIRIRHLLTQTLDFDLRMSEKKGLSPGEILDRLLKARLRSAPGTVFRYANATSVLLGLAVERAAGESLDRVAERLFFRPLGMRHTTFFPEKLRGAAIAPAENDPWRGRTVCGAVHDESAWALRPLMVAGSAGLFSTAADMLEFCIMLLNDGESAAGRRVFQPATVRLMHENALPAGLGVSASLGWELDKKEFMGSSASPSMFGKTGFTGCVFAADPSRKAGFVMMANHTFPRRRQDRSAINAARRRFADLLFDGR